jgi:hypothetical protein
LSECGSEIAMFDANSKNEGVLPYDINCYQNKCYVKGVDIGRSCKENNDCR